MAELEGTRGAIVRQHGAAPVSCRAGARWSWWGRDSVSPLVEAEVRAIDRLKRDVDAVNDELTAGNCHKADARFEGLA
jgi:hypothetical protein